MHSKDNSLSQIEGLATLLILDEEIRKLTNIREFGFFSTNETHRLLPYHTAYLWQVKDFIGTHLLAQSGTAEIDIHAPSNQWIITQINKLRNSKSAKEIHSINFEKEVPEQRLDITSSLPGELPGHLLWCPLLGKNNQLTGGLLFLRETPFTESEVKMLRWLIASYQYTWLIIVKGPKLPPLSKFKEKPYFIGLTLALLIFLLFPLRISVFADGTVVPKDPVLINAPMQGVIKSFAVNPGDKVKEGQLLLTIDQTDLLSTTEVSRKDLQLTQAKLRTAVNQGFTDRDVRAEIPILQAQLAIDKAHLDYAQEQLNRAEVRSPVDGLVIFESKDDWVGQPIKTGERILLVANTNQVELKIILPVANSIQLAIGDEGKFFLYGKLTATPFKISRLGYNAKLMPNKILAYQLNGEFTNQGDLPQLGAQGTVKIYGKYVPLIYYFLRRPIQSIRQTFGF